MTNDAEALAPTPAPADDEIVPVYLSVFTDLSIPWVLWPAERVPDPVIDRLHDAGFSLRRFLAAHANQRVAVATFVHLEEDDSVAEFKAFFGPAVKYELLPAGSGPLFGALFVLAFGGLDDRSGG